MPIVPRRIAHRLGVAILLTGMLGTSASADVLVLKNGEEYEGAVLTQSPKDVTFLSNGIEWTFARAKVSSLKRDAVQASVELERRKRRQAAWAMEDSKTIPATPPRPVSPPAPPRPHVTAPAHPHPSYTSHVSADSVTIYGTTWCGYCKKARAYLTSRNVSFEDKDIEADPEANEEMQRKCTAAGVRVGGVPVIDVYGSIIKGFDERRIAALLDSHGD